MNPALFFFHVKRVPCVLLALFALSVLGGCVPYQKTAPGAEPTVPLTGTVTYRERMALPPDAELYVSLYRRTSGGRSLIAESRTPTEGKNIPLPFSIAIPKADSSSMAYELSASILSGGATLFSTERPQMVHPGDADIALLTYRVMETPREQADLGGIRWKLVELGGKPAEAYDNQPEPYLLFDPEGMRGRLAGSDGCNSLVGTYALEGGKIRFSQLGSTMMLCPQGEGQARALAQALAAATELFRSGDRLELRAQGKRLAAFQAVAL